MKLFITLLNQKAVCPMIKIKTSDYKNSKKISENSDISEFSKFSTWSILEPDFQQDVVQESRCFYEKYGQTFSSVIATKTVLTLKL